MPSVKISQLRDLPLISSDDFFPLVDSGSLTTYHADFNDVNAWLKLYGSASWATSSISSSYARTSSFSISSSWAPAGAIQTTVLSASWASSSISASFALTASNLKGFGTSSEQTMIISTSLVLAADAGMLLPRKSYILQSQEGLAANSLFFNKNYGIESSVISNDFGRIFYIENPVDSGRLVIELGDNTDSTASMGPSIDVISRTNPGFLFSTQNINITAATSSLLFLRTDGTLYGRVFEGREFSASFLANRVGFYGTASCAVTASYVANLPTAAANVTPAFVKNLSIRPNWTPYDASNVPISIALDEVIVRDTSSPSNTKRLSSDSYTLTFTNNRGSSGAGGIIGAFTQNLWYDIWIIYNSGTDTVSSAIISSGATPKASALATVLAGAAGYDYGIRIGSVLDENSIAWRQWYEYGFQTMWAYRKPMPTAIGVANGFNVTHYLNTAPRNVQVKLKVKSMDSTMVSNGFAVGDEVSSDDFINDYNGGDVEIQSFLTMTTDSTLKFSWVYQENGWKVSSPTGYWFATSPSYWDVLIYSWI